MTKWVIKKKIKLNGRTVEVIAPNPKVSREEAYKELQKVLKEIVRRKASSNLHK